MLNIETLETLEKQSINRYLVFISPKEQKSCFSVLEPQKVSLKKQDENRMENSKITRIFETGESFESIDTRNIRSELYQKFVTSFN